MPIPADIAGLMFRGVYAKAEPEIDRHRVEQSTAEKRALLTKVADLACVPDHRRESFVGLAAGAIGFAWMTMKVSPRRAKGGPKILNAYRKVLAARNAVVALNEQDRKLIGEEPGREHIITHLELAAIAFSCLITGDFPPAAKGGAGSPKGTSRDPIFRGFLTHLCGAIKSHGGSVTFTHKSDTPVTGTMVEILTLLQPELQCIPRVLSSRGKMIKSVLKQHGLATRVPQNSK